MAKWIEVGSTSDFESTTKKCVEVEGVPVVVCHVGGDWYAVANTCPHAGLPLGEGDLQGKILTCPFHGYTYNVATGVNIDMPDDELLERFEVKVEVGKVLVEVGQD